MTVLKARIRIRRDTAANWTAANPVLGLAEPAEETDTGERKFGDGVTPWNSLPYTMGLVIDAVVTGATGSIAANHYTPVDATIQPVVLTLPNAPADKTRCGAKMVITASSHTAQLACSGSDVINKAGGSTTYNLSTANQGVILQYTEATKIWTATSDDLALSQLDARYALGNPLIYDSFTGKTGAPSVTDSGHAYNLTGAQVADLVISGNVLTLSPVISGGMAAYAQLYKGTRTSPTAPITRLGCMVSFLGGTTEANSFGLNVWNSLTIGSVGGAYSCAHLDISTSGWAYGVWINGVFTTISTRFFENALPLNTPMLWELIIDQPNGRAYVKEPDGAMFTVSDPLIRQGLPGYYATWEPVMASNTDWVAGISSLWADVQIATPLKAPQAEVITTAVAVGRRG